MHCRRSRVSVVCLSITLALPSSTFAHNEPVHQRMTDYAYHVMLAAKVHVEGGEMSERLRVLLERLATDNPGLKTFYADARQAVGLLRALKSGLPFDDTPCVTPGLVNLVGSGAPNWQLPADTALTDARMDQVRLPVTIHYGHGTSGGTGSDFHRNTTDRGASAWETPTLPHLQLTAVDNLGMFGYLEAKGARGTPGEASRLGWPLHAIGDASVPMHAVGASGYGHRPYEDCVDMVYDELVGSESLAASLDTVGR